MDSQLLRGRLIAVLLAALAAPALAQFPPRTGLGPRDYFPLALGNRWVYAQRGFAGGGQRTVEVTLADQFQGVTYFELTGFASAQVWVRRNAAGELVQWDPAGDKLWYAFAAPERFSWRPELPEPCTARAELVSRSEEVQAPAGRFAPVLVIRYDNGGCADAGLLEEVFAPGVGLIRRTEQTIGGPRIYELAFAQIDGQRITGPELSFGLAIDRPVYVANLMPPVLNARFTARNSTDQPVTLQFNSGQQYDLAIRDEAGRQVFLWSDGKFFTLALSRIELGPGETTFLVDVRLADRAGAPLPPGRYTVEAWLTTSGGKLYSATVPFEIRHVF